MTRRSRYKFMGMGLFGIEAPDLTQQGERFLSFLLVQAGNSEAGVKDHPISLLDTLQQGEVRRDFRPEIIDMTGTAGGVDFNHSDGNG